MKWSACCPRISVFLGAEGRRDAGAPGRPSLPSSGVRRGDLKLRLSDLNYWTTARLKPGASPASAQAELNIVQSAINRRIPGDFDLHATVTPLVERIVGDARQGLVLLMAAVGVVLMVLCVNLANLSLARAAGGRASRRSARRWGRAVGGWSGNRWWRARCSRYWAGRWE